MARRRRGERSSRGPSLLGIVFVFLIFTLLYSLVNSIIDTLSPEALTAFAFVFIILAAAVIVTGITILFARVIKPQERKPRAVKTERQQQQPQIIVLGGNQQQLPQQQQQQQVAPPERQLPEYTEGQFRVVSDKALPIKVIGGEDNAW